MRSCGWPLILAAIAIFTSVWLPGAQGGDDLVRFDRQVSDAYAVQSIGDRVANGRGYRRERCFADALGAERSLGVRRFDYQGNEFPRMIFQRRKHVFEKVAVDGLPLVIDHLFEERRAHAR